MNRDKWLIPALGLSLGIIGGLYYAWFVNPVSYRETAPSSLRADFKANYIALIASAYDSTNDLKRAQFRLDSLDDPNPIETLSTLAQQGKALGLSESQVKALKFLITAIEQNSPTTTSAATNSTSSKSLTSTAATTIEAIGTHTPKPPHTPTHTSSPSSAHTATATSRVKYELQEEIKICDPDLDLPLLQVRVVYANGNPAPGVEIRVIWDEGQDHFFTGLKPELGLDYGDFAMTEGTVYTVQLVGSSDLVTHLAVEDCTVDTDETYPCSWLLRYGQPSP